MKKKTRFQAPGTSTQTLILSKDRFETEAEAAGWVRGHDFIVPSKGADETEDSWRFRQFDPESCVDGGLRNKGKFRTIQIDEGISAVVCSRAESGTCKARRAELQEFTTYGLGDSINEPEGILTGVSVITLGEARGHGMIVDETTLEQVRDCAQEFRGGVKVKLNHGSGVEDIVGALQNFRIQGEKLMADLHLLRTHAEFDHLLEIARTMPDTFGLSISFSGQDEEIDGTHFARCSELYSVDLVTEPAANPTGLFKAVDKENDGMTEKIFAEFRAAIESSLKGFEKRLEALDGLKGLEERLKAIEAKFGEHGEMPGHEDEEKEKEEMSRKVSEAVIRELAKVGVPPVAAPAAPGANGADKPKKFMELVDGIVANGKKRGEAISLCIKQHPKEYREFREKDLGIVILEK